ncbi:MAG: hypothetical protein ILP16_02265 [Spirochaetales bacterium]|nr:hypothetical protein [Spirochaetales bacterium]
MRKITFLFIIVVLLLGITACSQEFYSGLGSGMGAMSHNIYGIKPDVRKAQASADYVSGAIVRDKDGNITIDLDHAALIIDTIADIKKSPQRAATLRELLDQDVPAEDAEAVREAIISQSSDLLNALDNYAVDESMADVRWSIMRAIQNVHDSLEITGGSARTPQMEDIALTAILNKMAASIMKENVDAEEVSDIGRKSVDTIKVIADIATLDILADVNFTALVENTTKDISRAEGGVINPVAASIMGKTVSKMVDLISTDKQFDELKYNTFIMESKALKAAYEMTYVKYMPVDKTVGGVVMMLFEDPGKIDCGLTIEDFFMYLMLSLHIGFQDYTNGIWGAVVASYVHTGNNYEILSDLDHATEEPSSLGDSVIDVLNGIDSYLQKYGEKYDIPEDFNFDTLMDEIEAKKEADPEYTAEDELDDIIHALTGRDDYGFSDMMESIGDLITATEEGVSDLVRQFSDGFTNVITTSLVMLTDAEYQNLLDLLFGLITKMLPPL